MLGTNASLQPLAANVCAELLPSRPRASSAKSRQQQELCNVARRHSSLRGGRVGFIYKNQNIFLIIPRPSRITRKGEKIWLLKTTYCHPNFRRSVVVPSLPYFALVFTMLCFFLPCSSFERRGSFLSVFGRFERSFRLLQRVSKPVFIKLSSSVAPHS